MSNSFSDILKIEEKKALYVILFLTCLTPGILYLYLKDPTFFTSLTNTKTILLGLAGAAPALALNMILAFTVAYLAFTCKKYEKSEKRLEEKVMNRVALTSGIMATGLSLNLSVVALYFMDFNASGSFKVLAVLVDVAFVVAFVFLMRRKVNQDLFHHNFGG